MKRRSGRVSRLVAALAVAASALSANGATARAEAPTCQSYDVAFGVTGAGALVEHDYCTEGKDAGKQASREVAPAGWWQGGTVLSAGAHAAGGTLMAVDVYQVAPDGTLLWYTDNGNGRLGPGRPMVGNVADWRTYRSLFSTGDGRIAGIDATGRVLEWWHINPSEGSTKLVDPAAVGSGFTGRELLTGRTGGGYPDDFRRRGEGFFGTDPACPWSITYWSPDGRVVARDLVLGAPLLGTPSWVDEIAGYARGLGGRVVRLAPLPPSGQPTVWVPEVLRPGGAGPYVRVFAGGVRPVVANLPWEWQ